MDAASADLGGRSRILRAARQAPDEHGGSAETTPVLHAPEVGAEPCIDLGTRRRLRRPGPGRVHVLLRGSPRRGQATAGPTRRASLCNDGERVAEVEARGQNEAFGRDRGRKAFECFVADRQLDTPPVEVRTPPLPAIRVPTSQEFARWLSGVRRQGLRRDRRPTQTHEHDHASGGDSVAEDVGNAHRTLLLRFPRRRRPIRDAASGRKQAVCQVRQEPLKPLVFSRLREERGPVRH